MTLDRRTYLAGQAIGEMMKLHEHNGKQAVHYAVTVADALLAELQRTCKHDFCLIKPQFTSEDWRACAKCGLEKTEQEK